MFSKLLIGCSKGSQRREREVRRAEACGLARWNQPGKRNEAYEAFSAALPGCRCPFFDS